MFDKRPKNLTAAAILAAVGGLVAMVAAFTMFDPSDGDVLATAGVLLLLSVLFIAIAGAMTANGQWTWKFTMFMAFLCAIIVVVAYIYSALNVELAVTLLVISLATAICISPKSTANSLN